MGQSALNHPRICQWNDDETPWEGEGDIVVGIGIGEHEEGIGSTSDLVYLNPENWSDFIQQAEGALKAAGYFAKSTVRQTHHEEYPKINFFFFLRALAKHEGKRRFGDREQISGFCSYLLG